MKKILTFCFLINLGLIITQKDDLSINFLPSSKYKINNKDLSILKSDIERQVLANFNNFS